ncbi:C-type lectin 37Db [Zeugodacus cucurbitae]|uniref:C-type lectin 37Db n=1 Tax=Zeugodacus cucurbitae TaxID=28588 RepID=UPI0023D92092|nr:C-type lectin 37Db [Zeugodacus cucurbitae]
MMGLVRHIQLLLLFINSLIYTTYSTTVHEEVHMDLQPFVKVGSKYYLVHTDLELDWAGAAHLCRSYDSDLLTIESKAEKDALSAHLKKTFSYIRAWTSSNDFSVEGEYMSFNTGRPMIYKYWRPNEPNNEGENEHCIEVVQDHDSFAMNDNVCAKKMRVICEKRLPSNIRNSDTNDKSKCEQVTTNCVVKKLVDGYLQATNTFHCKSTN